MTDTGKPRPSVDKGTRNLLIASLNAQAVKDEITFNLLLNAAIGNEAKARAADLRSAGIVDIKQMIEDLKAYIDILEAEVRASMYARKK